jgi:hypothetical protein
MNIWSSDVHEMANSARGKYVCRITEDAYPLLLVVFRVAMTPDAIFSKLIHAVGELGLQRVLWF